jgi:hypothetical protein
MTSSGLDCVYVAASEYDARFTRICVASIRHFYPTVTVRLLPGGLLERNLCEEMRLHWGVSIADIPSHDWGWGFVKLEPLFGPPGERFFVVDSDTVFAGRVLDAWEGSADFLVDDEPQTETDTHRLYYDWRKVADTDPGSAPPQFVFNSGQWFGTAGKLTREDFEAWIEWTMPRRLRHPGLFMPGEQGVLNYVINRVAARGFLRIDRRKIMRWPMHGMEGIDAASITAGVAPPVVVHWAGIKRARLNTMPGADVLNFFERIYYENMCSRKPARGIALRHFRSCQYFLAAILRDSSTRARLLGRRLSSSLATRRFRLTTQRRE